jgi:hypothetical protein
MLELREIMRSVCNISSMVASNGMSASYHEGIGVFIAPDKVLTAWHVVQGGKSVTFTNSEGETAKFKRGAGAKKMEKFDLAVAVLDRPIGREVCLVPDPDSAAVAKFDKGYLLTRFNRVAAHHRVSVDHEANEKAKKSFALNSQFLRFKAAVDLRQGYSGSPVVDDNGFVMSVACMVELANTTKVMNGKEAMRLKEKSFLGPSARDTAVFLRNAL